MMLTRRPPWLAGLLLLVLAVALVAPLVSVVGAQRWPFLVGLAALVTLAFGGLERLWQRLALPRATRLVHRRRFRVVPGGKKGNGHAEDGPDDSGDRPRWLM
jgi:hypothetical protein